MIRPEGEIDFTHVFSVCFKFLMKMLFTLSHEPLSVLFIPFLLSFFLVLPHHHLILLTFFWVFFLGSLSPVVDFVFVPS
jgi:hypothetical protein